MSISKAKEENLIWVDLEMTGLDPLNDRIIEMATIVTDGKLNIVAEGPVFAVNQPESVLKYMDDWNEKHHSESGLLARVRASDVNEATAQRETLAFLKQHVPSGVSPMCGNSICQDRRFLYKWMLSLEEYFHYRNLDVSTIKELLRRWKPDIFNMVKKREKHEALADIRESIDELKLYRKQVFGLS